MRLLNKLLKRKHDPELVSRTDFDEALTKEHNERRDLDARLDALELSIELQSRGYLPKRRGQG